MNKAYKLSLWILQQDPDNESGLAPRAAKSILPEENADQVLEYDGHLVAVEVSNPPKASPSATSVR
jgi:hypothetical protein